MGPRPYQSSYLIKPVSSAPKVKFASGRRLLKRQLWLLWRLRPHLPVRIWAGLALWAILLSLGLQAFQHQSLPPVPADVAAADGPSQASRTASRSQTPVRLANAAKVIDLPGGATGQLLPPGTLAPAGTYANSYIRGQCTSYVASRRPVPRNWGHARSWFARASAAGWATGTTPAVAAIAWTPTGWYGHVALVEEVDVPGGQVLISEVNYLGPYKFDKRWVKSSAFKYIY